MDCKGPWYKARLALLCGHINKRIENAAEEGCYYVRLYPKLSSTISKYFAMIKQLYEDLGFEVSFDQWSKSMKISWDNKTKKIKTKKKGTTK